MILKYDLDGEGNELKDISLEKLPNDPYPQTYEGRLYYNTTNKKLRYYDGSIWKDVFIIPQDSTTAGNGTSTYFLMGHNLNSININVVVRNNLSGLLAGDNIVLIGIVDTNTIFLSFFTPPLLNEYTVLVYKI